MSIKESIATNSTSDSWRFRFKTQAIRQQPTLSEFNNQTRNEPTAIHELLGRIASGEISVADWNVFSLKPFLDQRLEKIRRRIVDCAMTSGQCSARPASAELQVLASSILDQWDWWCPGE